MWEVSGKNVQGGEVTKLEVTGKMNNGKEND
jgi:hypothetical protein